VIEGAEPDNYHCMSLLRIFYDRLRLVKAKINVIFFSQKITGKVSPGTRFCILAHIRAAKRDLKTEVVYTGE